MSLDAGQFRREIVGPTLAAIGLHSWAAENLIVGTALAESGLSALRQKGGGPALGLFQIEPATAKDIRRYLIERNIPLGDKIGKWVGYSVFRAADEFIFRRLVDDLALGCAFARAKYAMIPEPLPQATDIAALGQYWKRYYNTDAGAGTIPHFVEAYQAAHPRPGAHPMQQGA